PTMNELFADDSDATAIGIMAATAPLPNTPGTHAVQLKVTTNDLQFEHKGDKWISSFDLGLALIGEDKALVRPIALGFSDEELKKFMEKGIVLDASVPSPSKPTQLRVVVQDKTRGTAGSVRIPIAPAPAQ